MRKTRTPQRPDPVASIPEPSRPPARWVWVLLWAAAPLILGGGVVLADWWVCLPDSTQATFVGRQACIDCHREANDAWQGSHHDLAMDVATPQTVLGDFNDAEFEQFGIRSRMFRRDGKYWVHTEGPDGAMTDFEVKWVFGVDPLQQYMVEFDRPADMPEHEIARVQVLRICWDTKRKEWFYLHPPDVRERLAPDDDLHWTGVAQRWNNMCADCHSTNLQKNYDVATNTYHTTFSEIDVSCETCHGPGSVHVELANAKSLFWDRKRGYGLARLKDNAETLIQTCAPCHSRRSHVYPGFPPGGNYYDYYNNELLQRTTYHADGQILDEVYEYASFIQSKMYHKGIRCTDCHDPHKAKPKYTGNALCTSCHQHPAGKYDTPAHHFHQPDSTGAACVECHMPQTTYMEVHPQARSQPPQSAARFECPTGHAQRLYPLSPGQGPGQRKGRLAGPRRFAAVPGLDPGGAEWRPEGQGGVGPDRPGNGQGLPGMVRQAASAGTQVRQVLCPHPGCRAAQANPKRKRVWSAWPATRGCRRSSAPRRCWNWGNSTVCTAPARRWNC